MKQVIFSSTEPDRNQLWLHRVEDNLVIQAYGVNGWETIGDCATDVKESIVSLQANTQVWDFGVAQNPWDLRTASVSPETVEQFRDSLLKRTSPNSNTAIMIKDANSSHVRICPVLSYEPTGLVKFTINNNDCIQTYSTIIPKATPASGSESLALLSNIIYHTVTINTLDEVLSKKVSAYADGANRHFITLEIPDPDTTFVSLSPIIVSDTGGLYHGIVVQEDSFILDVYQLYDGLMTSTTANKGIIDSKKLALYTNTTILSAAEKQNIRTNIGDVYGFADYEQAGGTKTLAEFKLAMKSVVDKYISGSGGTTD